MSVFDIKDWLGIEHSPFYGGQEEMDLAFACHECYPDMAPFLIYADWLEEHGKPKTAARMRQQRWDGRDLETRPGWWSVLRRGYRRSIWISKCTRKYVFGCINPTLPIASKIQYYRPTLKQCFRIDSPEPLCEEQGKLF